VKKEKKKWCFRLKLGLDQDMEKGTRGWGIGPQTIGDGTCELKGDLGTGRKRGKKPPHAWIRVSARTGLGKDGTLRSLFNKKK